MKHLIYFALVCIGIPFTSAGQDAMYYQDTAISLNDYSVRIWRDRFDRNDEEYDEENLPYAPVTINIINTKTGNFVVQKRFEQNEVDIRPQIDGKLPLGLITSAGGSGFAGTMYLISITQNKAAFTELFTYNELSYFAFSETGKEALLIKGVWNMDEDESHFSNHTYKISKITLTDKRPVKAELGETRFKYSNLDEGKTMKQILLDIKKREPLLLKFINVDTFNY